MWPDPRQNNNQSSPVWRERSDGASSWVPAVPRPGKRKINDRNSPSLHASANANASKLGWQASTVKQPLSPNVFEQQLFLAPRRPFDGLSPSRLSKAYPAGTYFDFDKASNADFAYRSGPLESSAINCKLVENTDHQTDSKDPVSSLSDPSNRGIRSPNIRPQQTVSMPYKSQIPAARASTNRPPPQPQHSLFLGLPTSVTPIFNSPMQPQPLPQPLPPPSTQAQLQLQLSPQPQPSFFPQIPILDTRSPPAELRSQTPLNSEPRPTASATDSPLKPYQETFENTTRNAQLVNIFAARSKTPLAASALTRHRLPVFNEPEPRPLRYKAFKEHIQRVNCEVEQHHSQCAASWIARANTGAANAQTSLYKDGIRMDKTSPFSTMNKIPYHNVSRSKLAPGEQILAYYVPSETSVKADDTTAVYRTKSYSASAYTIPLYTHYASSKRNILVEGVRQRTFLPYLGETDENLDEDYKTLQFKILSNQDKNRDLMDGEEFGSVWLPYVHSLLLDLGTSVHAVLRILLDDSRTEPPESLPSDLRPMFQAREDWISHGFYEEEDDVEATKGDGEEKPQEPQRQWQNALSNLPVVDDRSLAAAIMVCSIFDEVAGFSIWHIIRQSSEALEAVSLARRPTSKEKDEPERALLHAYVDQACLVCKTHQCLGHGEYSDGEDEKDVRIAMTSGLDALSLSANVEPSRKRSETVSLAELQILLGRDPTGSVEGGPWANFSDESPGLKDDEFCSADCFWDKRNRRTEKIKGRWSRTEAELLQAVGPPNVCQKRGACAIARMGILQRTCVEIFGRLVRMVPPKAVDRASRADTAENSVKNKPWSWWMQHSQTWKHQQRNPFRPCNHSGSCKENPDCSCTRQGISCEKSCKCSASCSRRFRGCQCAARGKPCYQSETCDCFKLNRECDPDVCHTCGAHEILDPVNRYEENISKGRCCNVSIQRALPKRTLLGQSKLLSAGGIIGWGLFMGESVKRGEYVGEYVGEIVTPDEAEQRGIIYNAMNLSYLFDLNKKQVLDSTPIGNKLRYINHQGDEFANCRAQVMFCAGVQRIGMFTTKNIDIGEELLFNYGDAFASKIDLVTMHRDGTITIEKANKAAWDSRSSPIDEEEDALVHHKNFGPRHGGRVGIGKGRGHRKMAASSDDDEGDEDEDGEERTVRGKKIIPRRGGRFGNSKGRTQRRIITASEDEDDQAGREDEDDGLEDEDNMELEKDDDDDENDTGPRGKPKSRPPTGKDHRSRVSKGRVTGSDRMRKAWITRYYNLGRIAEAQLQRKKYQEGLKSRKRGGPTMSM